MAMSGRIQGLKRRSTAAQPALDPERARLLTEFYRGLPDQEEHSPVLVRARAFRYLLAHRSISIPRGEWLVGEKGSGPRAAPTYPELCCHTLQDLKLLDSRKKIRFGVDQETRRLYQEEIIPFWRGRTMREKIFRLVSQEWRDCYTAGVFTEFMEQRSPGHTVLDNKIYEQGMEDLISRITTAREKFRKESGDHIQERLDQLEAMEIAAKALTAFAGRYAELAERQAAVEQDPAWKEELVRLGAICRRVPAHPPRTFREALQYYWFVHLGVTLELNPWDAFCPGHLDQHLEAFYRREIERGSLTREQAKELLMALWIKFDNQPAPPKVGVTAEESGTYTDFVQINLGGIRPDGSDGVSEVSYLILDVIEEMHQVQPNPSVHLSTETPVSFALRTAEVIRRGTGKPDLFNSEVVVAEMVRAGKSLEDARAGGTSGCVETGAFGKESYILTGYFNLPKVLEITLNNGVDPRTGEMIGLETGAPGEFETYQDLFDSFQKQLNHFLEIKLEGNRLIEAIYMEEMPAPFLSLLIDDCIESARDYHAGGARYNTNYIQGVGLGTITDALTALKVHVFEEGVLTMAEVLELLENDFAEGERERQLLLNRTPRYGNDHPVPDGVMREVFQSYFQAVEGHPTPRGGTTHVNLLPTTCHIYFGSVLGATPDGRKAGQPVSEGISPVQGADQKGPTAVLRSAAKFDHTLTGGTLLNQKINPQLVEDQVGLEKLVSLIRTYFRLGGHHIQFNVVDRATLLAARANPDRHRDLIVRVAGYSDYFCDLSDSLQEEIISRTEHRAF